MHYIKQFFIILLFSFLGELLGRMLPLPIPAAIYGLVLMFLALQLRVVKLEQVRDTGNFLLSLLPIIFIPLSAAMLQHWPELRGMLVPLFVISIASTVLVLVVTGRVTQGVIRRKGRVGHE